jgi:hypothetical protein
MNHCMEESVPRTATVSVTATQGVTAVTPASVLTQQLPSRIFSDEGILGEHSNVEASPLLRNYSQGRAI